MSMPTDDAPAPGASITTSAPVARNYGTAVALALFVSLGFFLVMLFAFAQHHNQAAPFVIPTPTDAATQFVAAPTSRPTITPAKPTATPKPTGGNPGPPATATPKPTATLAPPTPTPTRQPQ